MAERGEAWLNAGRLYLDHGLPGQAVEVGLRAVVFEEEQRENIGVDAWDDRTAGNLRLLLGRAFFKLGHYRRATILLEDYVAREGVTPAERGMGNYFLGLAQREYENTGRARASLSAARRDMKVPKIWRDASAEILARLDYDPVERFDALFSEGSGT